MLYPAPLRDLLLELAVAGLFRAKWTDRIHDEWIEAVLRNRKDLTLETLTRTRRLMDAAVMDAIVKDYEELIEALTGMPDLDDRHVVAAAIATGADAIITFNTKDFPRQVLSKYDIEAQHPDEFLLHQFGLDASKVVVAAQRVRARLRNPKKSVEEYLEILESQSLPLTVGELRPYSGVL